MLGAWHLRRRLARGREDPLRWREKLGVAGQPRPDGRLIWLHGVGVGEVMALRGVIDALGRLDPDLNFLVTSSARSSAQVIAANLPARTIHHYLPLDAPAFVARFLDHWRPDISIWSDQEVWPQAVLQADLRGIPLLFLNARITPASLEKRRFAKALYSDILMRFQLVLAQDPRSMAGLQALGRQDVGLCPSLKAYAPVLRADAGELDRMQTMFKGRKVWVAASTHAEDEAVAMAAQARLFDADPRWLLVLVPRDPKRYFALDLPFARRSAGEMLAEQPVYLADSFGELGLWYRLSVAALMGGSFGPVEGHNPWEAALLGCPVMHGPRVANFENDYKTLQGEAVAFEVTGVADVLGHLLGNTLADAGPRGAALARDTGPVDRLAARILDLMP